MERRAGAGDRDADQARARFRLAHPSSAQITPISAWITPAQPGSPQFSLDHPSSAWIASAQPGSPQLSLDRQIQAISAFFNAHRSTWTTVHAPKVSLPRVCPLLLSLAHPRSAWIAPAQPGQIQALSAFFNAHRSTWTTVPAMGEESSI